MIIDPLHCRPHSFTRDNGPKDRRHCLRVRRSTPAAGGNRARVGRQHLGRAAGEARRALVFAQFEPGDLVPVDLVGAVGQPQRAGRRPGVGEAEIAADAGAAVGLDRPVDHPQAMFGATTLIIAISARAALLPTVSIM